MYIKHIVTDIDKSMIQRCIICGEIINDYTNAMWPQGQKSPKGYSAGNVYVSKNINPTIYLTDLVIGDNEFENCS